MNNPPQNTLDGRISIWQDGRLILKVNGVKTMMNEQLSWGVGNYTDHISGGPQPGTAIVYFDDATISTKPTHKYVGALLKKLPAGRE